MRRLLLFLLALVPLATLRAFPPGEEAVGRFVGLLLAGFAGWAMIRHWLRVPLVALAVLLGPPDWALLAGLWLLYIVVFPYASRNRGLPVLSLLAGAALALHPSGLLLVGLGVWRVWGTWVNKAVAVLAFLAIPGWLAPQYLSLALAGCVAIFAIDITLHASRGRHFAPYT